MPRYIIYGAGGVGGLIGARLSLSGHEVTLIARGPHRTAIARHGLRFRTPTSDDLVKIPVVEVLSEVTVRNDDIVVLAMKTQDSPPALEELASIAPPEITIVCAQNGVEGERMALRRFDHVVGAYVYVFAAITEPGSVSCYAAPKLGIVDVGRYPLGTDERTLRIAADLSGAGIHSDAQADVMRWKRGKLLVNLANVINAACPMTDMPQDILTEAQNEAVRCFEAAGLAFASVEEVMNRGKQHLTITPVAGARFPGGSTAQGLARGSSTSEIDYLNGEVALLGRTHGIPTPVNAALQHVIRELIKTGAAPGSMSANELRRRVKDYASP